MQQSAAARGHGLSVVKGCSNHGSCGGILDEPANSIVFRHAIGGWTTSQAVTDSHVILPE